MCKRICYSFRRVAGLFYFKFLGFVHSTVNHQENYVNPASGTNTQDIERSCLDAKIKILRKMRGTTELLLQFHLNEYCYRVMRKHSPNLLIDFLNDIKRVYRWMCSFSLYTWFFHINTETYDSVYSSIKCMRKATSVFRIHCTQFLSGSTQYFISNTVDLILIGRSHIGRAPNKVLKFSTFVLLKLPNIKL